MKIQRVHALWFSPVGHTKEVVTQTARLLAETLSCAVEEDDFTLPAARTEKRVFAADEAVVFGVPTYAGRVPNKLLPFVQTLFEGKDTPAIAVVTFGNRSYDESLKELCLELNSHGFRTLAAGAFVCEHVMSEGLGAGRPDEADMEKLREMTLAAAKVMRDTKDGEVPPPVRVSDSEEVGPYYRPLEENGEAANFLKAKPVTNLAGCIHCGICAEVCPFGSIDPGDVSQTPGICVKCHACVRKCPVSVKFFDDPSLRSHIKMLERAFARPAQSEIFVCDHGNDSAR